MRIRISHVLCIAFLTIIFINNAAAQRVSKSGTTAASFLEIAAGARAQGLGGAFVSVADDASSLYWNPGGTGFITQREIVLAHTNWIADTRFNYAGLVLPLGELGNVGFSFTSLSMDDMMVRTVSQPDGTGEFFSAGDIAVGLTYSRVLTDRFSIGFTAKYVQQSIWHMNASAFAIDAGTLFKTDLFGGMVIGASIMNFGTPMKLEGRDARYFISVDPSKEGTNDRIPVNVELNDWELPLTFQIGVSTDIIKTDLYRFKAAVDALHPSNGYESINAGGEFAYMENFFIRGGYTSLFLTDGEGGLSLGAGLNTGFIFNESILIFDYAFRDFGRLNNIHAFSIGIKF